MTAKLPNIDSHRTDIEKYSAVTYNVQINKNVTFQGKHTLLDMKDHVFVMYIK